MKEIKFDQEARVKLMSGIEQLHRAVSSTLGARGRHVIFNQGEQIVVTKDGVTVANQFKLEDPIEDAGAKLVREASARTARDAGDGTTTSIVLAYSLIEKAMKHIDNGISSVEIKRGMEYAKSIVIGSIDRMKLPISSKQDLFNIAKISGNNDVAIGEMISDVFEKVGKSGAVRLEETQMNKTVVDVVHGCQIDKGFMHQNFITNQTKRVAELVDPVIFVTDKRFEGSIEELRPILEAAMSTKKPLMIFCNGMEGETLGTLMINKVQGNIQVLVVESPEYDRSVMQQVFKDIAIITGAAFVSEEMGVFIKDFTPEMFGSADKIISDANTTTIVGRHGDVDEIAERVKEIETEQEADRSNMYNWRLKRRIATLTGGVGVIYVGGNSPSETKEMYYRLEDALAATKAALEDGFVPGGGIAYLRASESVISNKPLSRGEQSGFDLFLTAMNSPFQIMCSNSVHTYRSLLDSVSLKDTYVGYNAITDKVCNLLHDGIIDPTKVVKSAIINAFSVAAMIITTDCVIVDKPKK